MKCLRRYLCVLLCCVSLLVVFSVSVSAEELDLPQYTVTESNYSYIARSATLLGKSVFTPNDGTIKHTNPNNNLEFEGLREANFGVTGDRFNATYAEMIKYVTVSTNKMVLAEKGIKTTIKLENVYYTNLVEVQYLNPPSNPLLYYDYGLTYVDCTVTYADGTTEKFQSSQNVSAEQTANSFYYNLKLNFTPKDEVIGFTWQLRSNMKDDTGYNASEISGEQLLIHTYLGEAKDTDNKLTVIQPSEEETLLGGIWDSLTSGFSALGDKLTDVWSSITNGFKEMGNKLSSVITSITDGFTAMGNKLTDLFNSILELPGKLWSLIEEGLISLFVPSEDSMVEIKARFEAMLEEKYGAVWEVVQITFGSWENINASDLKNTISVPEVSIPLPDDTSFSFGGEEVKVIPDGFEAIASICKMASGAFCTLLFINGLRKRYDEVMAVEK